MYCIGEIDSLSDKSNLGLALETATYCFSEFPGIVGQQYGYGQIASPSCRESKISPTTQNTASVGGASYTARGTERTLWLSH